jgi:cytochrome c oxidase subunit III
MMLQIPVAVEEPKIGGRGPTIIPPRRDDGRGGGGNGRPDDFRDRIRRYRMGMFFAMVSIVMLFVAFSSAYIVRQGVGTWDQIAGRYVTDWVPVRIPGVLWLNTVILLVSSVTLYMARRGLAKRITQSETGSSRTGALLMMGRRDPVPWLSITLVLGLAFLAGQLIAWKQLAHQRIFISTNPSSAFFYVLTAVHGLHLLGGVTALAYATLISALKKPLVSRFVVVDVTSLYWHFMDVLWLYIFALLHFAR